MFEQIMRDAEGKQIIMFLDYDGTLSLITEDHDRAYITDEVFFLILFHVFLLKYISACFMFHLFFFCNCEFKYSLSLVLELKYILQMREVVKEVATYFKTAIISGRSTDKVNSINLYIRHYLILLPA